MHTCTVLANQLGDPPSRLRIVVVVGSLLHGGAESQFIALAKELVKRGHSVLIYTLRSHNPRIGELANTGVDVVVDQKKIRFDPALVLRLRERVKSYRADVIQGLLLEGNLYALLAAAGTGIPAIVSERNDGYVIPFHYRLAIRISRRLGRAVIANTQSGARFAQRLYRYPDKAVHVVPNAYLATPIDKMPAPPRDWFDSPASKIVTVVGTICPRKDQLLAVRTLQHLRVQDDRWGLLIVGGCTHETKGYKEVLEIEAKSLGISHVVNFVGFRPDAQAIVKMSDVVLSTSLHEGCPNVVLEAMAVGTPAVSTAYSDIKSILPFNWQVVDQRDPGLLAQTILRADRSRSEIVAAQEDWIRSNGSIEEVTRKLEAVYDNYAGETAK